jgi:hypothetical protein
MQHDVKREEWAHVLDVMERAPERVLIYYLDEPDSMRCLKLNKAHGGFSDVVLVVEDE